VSDYRLHTQLEHIIAILWVIAIILFFTFVRGC
jgi:hypothetical protein